MELSHIYHDYGMDKDSVRPLLWAKKFSYNKGSSHVASMQKKNLGLNLTDGKIALSFQA